METTNQASDGATATLARYIAGARYQDLPAAIAADARLHVLDALGAMAMGAGLDSGKLLSEFARREGGREESTVIGAGFRTTSAMAALVNGTLCHADEVDDVHPRAIVHGACAAVPPALAAGERAKCDGKTFICAVVLGYDIACRVSFALDPLMFIRTRHSPLGIPLCFGAVSAASNILGLNESAVCDALALTAQQASGTTAYFNEPRHMGKALMSGMSCRNGVTAALLAELGFPGAPGTFEGPISVFDIYPGDHDMAELTRELGSRYDIAATPFKKYPVGAPIQAPLEGLFRIMHEHALQAGDIESITVTMGALYASVVNNRRIQDVNLQYLLAAAACYGKLGPEEAHSARKAQDPRVADLRERVRLVGDPGDVPAGTAKIEIACRDGRRHALTLDRVPMGPAEVEAKFLELSSPVLGDARAREVIEAVGRLETIADVGELAGLLR